MKTSHHIIQICPKLNSGGIERGVVDVAIALRQAGMQSTVISGGGYLVKELQESDVAHIEFPAYHKSPLAILNNQRSLRKLFTELKPNLVHAYSRAPTWATYYALRSLHIPFITSCHSPHGLGILQLKKYYNCALTFGDKVIAISDFIAQYLQQNYQVAPQKITTIYRGIDTHRFSRHFFSVEDIIVLKQKWCIPQDKTIILLPGRITRWKGQDVLIKALHLLPASDKVHVIMVGRIDSHSFHQELLALINQYKLSNQIQFIDECFNMPALYALADITLSTSRKPEAFGRVAVEAQAMGSLVIATELGATKETVIDQETGFVIKADNPAALAKSIDYVLGLPQSRQSHIKQQARKRVIDFFSQETMLAKTLALYQSLLPHSNPSNHLLE